MAAIRIGCPGVPLKYFLFCDVRHIFVSPFSQNRSVNALIYCLYVFREMQIDNMALFNIWIDLHFKPYISNHPVPAGYTLPCPWDCNLLSRAIGSYEIARGSSHWIWVFFYLCYFSFFVLYLYFLNWINIFHLIFWIFNYHKTQILYLIFFYMGKGWFIIIC